MANATHAIVLMAPKGTELDIRRVSEVAENAGARIVSSREVPVPVSLADRREVHILFICCDDAESLSTLLRELSDQTGVDIALQTRRARCRPGRRFRQPRCGITTTRARSRQGRHGPRPAPPVCVPKIGQVVFFA